MRSRLTTLVLLAAWLLIAGTILWINRDFFHDDAYIPLRYARHLLDGQGLVWNPGERVQGYTSFLHVIGVAAIGRPSIDLTVGSRLLGILGLAGTIAAGIAGSRLFVSERDGAAGRLAALLLATSAPLLVWSLGGLEGTLFSAASSIWLAAVGAWTSRLTYLALCIAAYLAFIAGVGGDHMPAFRLLLPLVGPLSLIVAAAADRAIRTGPPATGGALMGIIPLLCGAQLLSSSLQPMTEDRASYVGTIVGTFIARAWPPGSVVALNTAGSVPYYAPRHRDIDMLGLNDRHIARRHVGAFVLALQHLPGHAKGDGAYVLSRLPDFVILGPAEGTVAAQPWFLSDLELSRSAEFARDYHLVQVWLDERGETAGRPLLRFTYYTRE